eukprot:548458-Pleurochrysis_carterae.AAC.1
MFARRRLLRSQEGNSDDEVREPVAARCDRAARRAVLDGKNLQTRPTAQTDCYQGRKRYLADRRVYARAGYTLDRIWKRCYRMC